ncbi:MAG TPA: hypothetical protein PKE26_05225 [Kiritimatiellia bacterium]|nr:hypothetical protein [Kiritimatiellia bacterium]HMO98494.1 hypothetical protein [Kiritimatiellia bacterium]HMP95802.1 hypothetical protein [Kiritimatiellia bacterium]
MKSFHLELELQSDVIVSARAATEGQHHSLDYLPGSALLGAAVATHGQFDERLFLGNTCRFHDALPMAESGARAVPMPLVFHMYKQPEQDEKNALLNMILEPEPAKQTQAIRSGYWVPDENFRLSVEKSYRLKSAIDRFQYGRAEQGKIFGYEAIRAGQRFASQIDVDDDNADYVDRIISSWEHDGLKIGRSRSAEYGAIKVTRIDMKPDPLPEANGSLLILYAESDIVLCREGQPVLDPAHWTPEQFVPLRYLPERSAIKTRRYSVYNSTYQAYTSERQVLSRGSVLVYDAGTTLQQEELRAYQQSAAGGVGLYRQEGLGRLLVNPPFLIKAPVWLMQQPARRPGCRDKASPPNNPLARLLVKKSKRRSIEAAAVVQGLALAREWAAVHKQISREIGTDVGKTQWAALREMSVRFDGHPEDFCKCFTAYCNEALRRRFWKEDRGGKKTAEELVMESLSKYDLRTLYHAAVNVPRTLREKDPKGGSQ